MAINTLTGWTNKFLQKLNTLDPQDKIDARALIDAASATDTAAALATKQPLDSDLTAYANAADAAARRALDGAAGLVSPTFTGVPTANTAAAGDRSAQLATTEFVWSNGPLKVTSPSGAEAGSMLAQFNNTDAADPLGFGAVDLQSFRDFGAKTATGNASFIAGGTNNTASGADSHAEGSSNTATGPSSHAEGISTTSIGLASHAEGDTTTASGNYSHAEGWSNTAGGIASHAEGGSNIASGDYSHAEGYGTTASLRGQVASGAASSISQHSRLDLYKETTNTTPAILAIDGSSAKLTIRSDWSMAGTINILGVKTDGTIAAHYIRKFAIKNVAGTTSLSGTVTVIGTDYESDAGLDVGVTANNADDSLDITVTGLAATTIRWAAVVDAVEVNLS